MPLERTKRRLVPDIVPPENRNTLVMRSGALGMDRPFINYGVLGEAGLMGTVLPAETADDLVEHLCKKYSRVVESGYAVVHAGLEAAGVAELTMNLKNDLRQTLPAVVNMFSELQRLIAIISNQVMPSEKVFVVRNEGLYSVIGGNALFGVKAKLLAEETL